MSSGADGSGSSPSNTHQEAPSLPSTNPPIQSPLLPPRASTDLPSSSYVFPVRSLLSGRIQPDLRSRETSAGAPFMSASLSFPDPSSLPQSSTNPSDPDGNLNGEGTAGSVSESGSRSRSGERPKISSRLSEGPPVSAIPSGGSPSGTGNSPNCYRHFPGEDNLYFPRTSPRVSTMNPDRPHGQQHLELSAIGGMVSDTFADQRSAQCQGHREEETPKGIADIVTTLTPGMLEFSEPITPSSLSWLPTDIEPQSKQPELETGEVGLPFNPSEYGLVHLPPLPRSTGTSLGSGSRSSVGSSFGHGSSTYTTALSHQSSAWASSAGGGGTLARVPEQASSDETVSENPAAPTASIPQSATESSIIADNARTGDVVDVSDPAEEDDTARPNDGDTTSSLMAPSGNTSIASSSEERIAFRFDHKEDQDGHHVVIGRKGRLLRCEDEPIRTPGAVQGYGVLIAVDEDVENHLLVVRQVSENAGELFGLSPKYLFGLECFTDTLPASQADTLWDNIQFLAEPTEGGEESEDSPHIFILSGWGEPESASPVTEDSPSENPENRRSWTAWCAVHRQPKKGDGPGSTIVGGSGLILMEFELERDTSNPLYPSMPVDNSTGTSSPSTTTTSTTVTRVSVEGSENTLIATNLGSPGSDALLGRPEVEVGAAEQGWMPSAEDIFESTTSRSKPLLALERLRRMTRPAPDAPVEDNSRTKRRRNRRSGGASSGSVGMMDVFAVMAQINEQLGAATDLEEFLKVVVGVIKDLTQFHRVLVYQFDEVWNGQTVAELVDWSQTHDLYKGLHFPASDIPAQARELYSINKVRLLYDRMQPAARIVLRSKEDLETPLDMTHCYLRAMSPIHIKYLAHMNVRASMSISIMAFGALWGLVTCHTYGNHGMRVSFPVRQMLRLLSQSISRNIERLSYAQRLHTRKLINTMTTDNHPTGYIVSNADDLLGLFDADYGILVIGEGAKILGPNQHGQEILVMAEYLRLKQFNTIQVSQAVTKDFPDLQLSTGLDVIAGLLYVPLSSGGQDFIAFLRRGQPKNVHWAGKPYQVDDTVEQRLQPRRSFKVWSETVAGRCRLWTDEQLETAGVLALVYGKFIEVWRQKESALQTTRLTNLLLSNASHEVRTPLNHIINYLEMALNGSLDGETRDNLNRSHAASKSLLFTINDLLDLTRLESGHETSFNEPFDLRLAIEEATMLYQHEAGRRRIAFNLDISDIPQTVVGDREKIKTVVSNLTANALKYTVVGEVTVRCRTFGEPEGLRGPQQTAVELVVADTGCGIAADKLESIFREFEQVESSERNTSAAGVGLGLAVVARIVEQLGGQLRVDSQEGQGSRFSFLIPLALNPPSGSEYSHSISPASSQRGSASLITSAKNSIDSRGSRGSEVQDFVEAFSTNHMSNEDVRGSPSQQTEGFPLNSPTSSPRPASLGTFEVTGSNNPVRPVKLDIDAPARPSAPSEPCETSGTTQSRNTSGSPPQPRMSKQETRTTDQPTAYGTHDLSHKLRILIVEDNDINRTILAKRLTIDGHSVVNTTNGQEGLDMIKVDQQFDCVLMDIQMPILNGLESAEQIRIFEKETQPEVDRASHKLNHRIPIFAVSASLMEGERDKLFARGLDGWILKPIDFKRLRFILKGVIDPQQRERDVYRVGGNWEAGGWLREPSGARAK